jgi:hypothetical protein
MRFDPMTKRNRQTAALLDLWDGVRRLWQQRRAAEQRSLLR